ncbi:MAG: DUF72 domain-containing protein [Thermoprotei archaeon]|nr:MAG: DUF72 domain-containing protein [Thermoprotei archaeon]RLF25466.1 MAG: DUF72 domain-containing protein [Thermoprotei archaeon]
MYKVLVGCCGWAVRGGKSAYFSRFKIVEVQETFYQLPSESTVAKWRSMAPSDFVFSMKAWQAITHPLSSPTWRRARKKPPREKANLYGFLRPTEENFKAWEDTMKIAKAMGAKVCVVQCPSSFKPTDENVRNAETFFSSISRDGVLIAWEPRGEWNEHLDLVKRICDRYDLIHVTDLLRRYPVSSHHVAYTRLHGLGPREVNYRYKYTDHDLKMLLERVKSLLDEKDQVMVLFNNIYMAEDAQRFQNILREEGLYQS